MGLRSFSVIIFCLLAITTSGLSLSSEVKSKIINELLAIHDTSESQILSKLVEANGNDQAIINGINSELKENLLHRDGELVKIKTEALKKILGKSTEQIASKWSGSPALASILREAIDQGLESQNDDLEIWAEDNAIPVKDLVNFSQGNDRRKRSVENVRGLLAFITSPINGLVKGVLKSILEGVYPTIGYLLLSPLRAILNTVLDLLLPCNNCTAL
ncbi:hypothetical protein TcasGA2_TC032569 [Tribolium castaneum]|uniref:Uncharacterized protein n=1 Tax=Tribolium castaneum TaxID=7070 RepID=A0A139WKN4_TRICA|nr:PREDICTED: uncharacterized protein LOC656151 isoform X2 [Tribolium castaneum]KYB28444.1 hypothetical protein TcasGA2_TC032569 [Tribolium castaneum]|eukprot:XP_975721.1 PREDICTED: uncharacterized protein LOC656151 isoform X2 [Tribolium castaneum]